ncbi:MAG: response regulator transcription factor [Lewinellaceae bacterium]|nr:response regulator transcription factor [Lewinellaceae bacterium]
MKIKAVILDDEAHSIETLQWKLENYCPEVEVVATFDDAQKGLQYLKSNPPDLLFLDIQMPMLNGFDVLEELGPALSFDVIFSTAYDQFGIQAIKASALDYLLKPVQNKELKEAVEKYIRKRAAAPGFREGQLQGLMENVGAEHDGKIGKVALATRESIEFVDPQEIVLCSSDSNYTMIFLSSGRKKLISRTLKEFEDLLTPFNFYRPHNSYLINLSKVKEYIRSDGGYIVMDNQMKVPVSKSRKDELLARLQ